MNGNQATRTARRIGAFCARHLIALLVTVAAASVLWTVAYFALLAWAVFADAGLGSPLAYPAWLLFVFVAGTAASLIFLFPSTALAEWWARRRTLPILAQIPLSVAVLAFLCLVTVSIAAATVGTPSGLQGLSASFGLLFCALLVPLGLYWWTAQGGPILLSLLQRALSVCRP